MVSSTRSSPDRRRRGVAPRWWGGGVAAAALAVLVTAAAAADRPDANTLVYAIQSDVQTYDAAAATVREDVIAARHVYDFLAERDPRTNDVIPHVAVAWTRLDAVTWRIELRRDVRFHDGSPLTALDVKATIDRILDPRLRLPTRIAHARIRAVEAVDQFTVRITLDGPDPLFVERLTLLPVQPARELVGEGGAWKQPNPIGSGPYRLARWRRGHEHVWERNDGYWGGRSAFRIVHVRVIPDIATQIAELLAGGVDVIKAVPPDQRRTIDASGRAHTVDTAVLRTAMILLDQAGRSGPNPFTDPRVRRAVNLAVDMDGIIASVLLGLADRLATVVNTRAFGFSPSVRPYRPDPREAARLLAESGHPNGFTVRFRTGLTSVEPGVLETSQAIAADLAKVKIVTRQHVVGDTGAYVAQARDGRAGPMLAWSWGYYSVFDADAILHDVFRCGGVFSYYCRPELDALITTGRTHLDPKQRLAAYEAAQRLLFDDAAALFKWAVRGVWGISNRVRYAPPHDEIDRLYRVSPIS